MYFVTTIKNVSKDFINYDNIRTVGFYSKFEDAEYTVLNNACDINEGMYDYAIIEELDEGLYPFSQKSFLYKFDYRIGKYNPKSLTDVNLSGTFTQVG